MQSEVKVVRAVRGKCRGCHGPIIKGPSPNFCTIECMTSWSNVIVNVLDAGDVLVGYEPCPAAGKLMERAIRKREIGK